jgi:hypothetical protein
MNEEMEKPRDNYLQDLGVIQGDPCHEKFSENIKFVGFRNGHY